MNGPGFLGTQASLFKDITLVLEILFYLMLCAGVVAQLKGLYKWHDRFQIPVVLLNILLIAFVMLPSFSGIAGSIPAQLNQVPVAVTLIHGILGTIAQGLAIYCLLAGLKYIPRKIGVLRYWMWAAFIAWTATVFFGVTTYMVYYAMPSEASTVGEHDAAQVAEHNAELPPAELAAATTAPEVVPTAAEVVSEHAAEVIPTEAAPATAEAIPATAEVVSEHAAEVIPTEAAPATAEVISEHAAEVVEATATAEIIPEPEFVGEMAKAAWEQLQPTNAGPGARYDHAFQYHIVSKQFYLFGGHNGANSFNDTWALDLDTLTWRELAANSPTKPEARYSLVSTVDVAGNYLYVTAGHGAGGKNFNDLWRLDLKTETWEDLTASAGAPFTARYGNGTPNGNLNDTVIVTHGFGTERYDDTWQFSPSTGTWANITPAGEKPLGRCLFAATPSEGNYVIHGGCATPNGPCFLDDAWLLNMQTKTWQPIISDIKPMGRQHHTLVAGATGSNRVILFGGEDANRAPRNDLWYLNTATATWQKVDAPNGPEPRYNHTAVWVPGRKAMVVHGGQGASGGLGDLWLLNLNPQ